MKGPGCEDGNIDISTAPPHLIASGYQSCLETVQPARLIKLVAEYPHQVEKPLPGLVYTNFPERFAIKHVLELFFSNHHPFLRITMLL